MAYKGTRQRNTNVTRVEAGSNTFTVTLRVVGGDERGKSQICDSKIWFPRDSDPRKIALAPHENKTVTVKQ
jgi:hypothetical protein